MNTIPKIAHFAWPSKEIVNSQSPIVLNGIRNFIDMNPDWEVNIYTDDEIDQYLKEQLQDHYHLIENDHIVAKTDLWRMLKIYDEGGLYMDIDRYYNIPMSEIITNETIKWVLPTNNDYDFSQDFILSSPGNPAIGSCIALQIQRRQEGHRDVFFLGPCTWMNAVTKSLFGTAIDIDPGILAFEDIRSKILEVSFIKTFREQLPYDTIVYKHDPETYKTGNVDSTDLEILKMCPECAAASGVRPCADVCRKAPPLVPSRCGVPRA